MRTVQNLWVILVFVGLVSLLVGNAPAQVLPITFDENGYYYSPYGGVQGWHIGPGPDPGPDTLIYKLGLGLDLVWGDLLIKESPTGPISDVVGFWLWDYAAFYSDADLQVGSVTVTNAGSGYTSPPTVTFFGNYGDGTQATGHAIISGGAVTSVVIDNPGSDYTGSVFAGFSGGGGSGATAYATLVNNPLHDLADVGLPTQFQTNQVTLVEQGTASYNWVDYTPLAGQPGYSPGHPGLTYHIVSDVPEPSTLILLGMGALGLLAYVWRRRQGK
jgi:hypothetical protein